MKHAASKKLVEIRLPASFLSDGNDDSFVRPHGAMDDMVSICNDAVCCHKSRVSLIFLYTTMATMAADRKLDQDRLQNLHIEFGDDLDLSELWALEYCVTNISVFPNKQKANSRRQVLRNVKKRNKNWKVPTFDEDFFEKFESSPYLEDLYTRARNGRMSVDASFTNEEATDDELGNHISKLSLRGKKTKNKAKAIKAGSSSGLSNDLGLKLTKAGGSFNLKTGAMYQGTDGLMAFFNKAGRTSDDGESKYQALTLVVALSHAHDEKYVSVIADIILFSSCLHSSKLSS